MRASLPLFAALLAFAGGCGDDATSPTGSGAGGTGGSGGSGGSAYEWNLPDGIPKPKVPADNPMSVAKVDLGRRLFYDKRLSGNQTQACASCHVQNLGFTDGKANAVGSTGEIHPRSSMGLTNIAYASVLTWANPLVELLEKQALLPMFGETPVELGLAGKETEMLGRLQDEPIYTDLFPKAFPGEDDPISLANVTAAIGAFERSLVSFHSPYDKYTYEGDPSGMSESALRGLDLFNSETLQCFHCHGGFAFSDAVASENSTFVEVAFHNTGLYNIDGMGAYPPDNTGVYAITTIPEDMGRFRAPSLRNIAVSAPYMHDGSAATLSDVLDHYAAGGRTIASGPYAGDGSQNPYKSEFITGFPLSPQDKADVIAFLESLTDQEFLSDPAGADPWAKP